MPNPDGSPTIDEQIKAAVSTSQRQSAVSQPIGVPYYITDPKTGQPQQYDAATGRLVTVDANDNPIFADTKEAFTGTSKPTRWGAPGTTTSTEDDLRYRGGRPGTRQVTQSQPTYNLPRYFDGSQWLPASLPPDQLAQLQKKMVAAGLLKSGEAQLGIWDTPSMNAYTKLLGFANASGLDSQAALDRWGMAHAADPNMGKAPLQTTVSNPDELAQVFRKAVIDTRGEGWNTDKINQMVAAYQGVERNAQTQSYNLSETGATNSPPVAPPSPTSFAQTQVRKEDPLGAQEHDVIGQGGPLDAFRQMLGGWQ